MADKPPHDGVETAPDPEEDDLDDLDDVLDELQAPKSSQKPASSAAAPATAPSASGPGRPPGPGIHDETTPSEEDFAHQLQEGMTSMIGELDSNPEMQREFEKMMQELIAAGQAGSDAEAVEHIGKATEAVPEARHAPPVSASASKSAGARKDDFQDTIRRTMERMQQSDSSQTAAAAQAGDASSEEDLLAQMMRELQVGGGGGAGEGDFDKMLMSMMTQLTNKEILYEPMKELHDKFPAWLEKNSGSAGKEDLERYREQQRLVGEIVARFERGGYSDENDADREYIVERMQKMQAAGSPPPDLVGDMSAAQEVLGELEGCPTQ